MASPTDQEQANFVSNLTGYFSTTRQLPQEGAASPSSRANTTISKRRSIYGEKTVSESAETKLKSNKT